MQVEFRNVTITVEAPTAKQAYERLAFIFAPSEGVEYRTDTYVTFDDEGEPNAERETLDFFVEG